jgi:hypothetical protein
VAKPLFRSDNPQHPTGGGGIYDALELPLQKFSALLCTGNTALSQPGRLSGGSRSPWSVRSDKMIFTEHFFLKKKLHKKHIKLNDTSSH